MALHPFRRSRRPNPTHTRKYRERRNAAIIAVALVALFVVALLLWTSGDDGKDGPDSALPTSSAPGTGSAPASGSPSPTGTAGTLPALPGFGNAGAGGGPNSTSLISLGPGEHRVVITARSNAPMLAVAYAVRGDKKGTITYNVKSPVVITRTMTGGRPFAAVALQVSNVGTTGSCSISIDGKVVDSRSVNKSYAVMGCSA